MILYPEQFSLKEPPYEYEYERVPLDLILGDTSLRSQLAIGRDLLDIESSWQDDIERFKETRRNYYIY
jgi:uncharacterized protein YbbC (DUF1343 family)